jgi:hypothetical protein
MINFLPFNFYITWIKLSLHYLFHKLQLNHQCILKQLNFNLTKYQLIISTLLLLYSNFIKTIITYIIYSIILFY